MKNLFATLALLSGLLVANELFADETNENTPASTTVIEVSTNVQTNVVRYEKPQKFNNYIGLYAGSSTGQGFTYRYFDDWGVQVCFIPIIMNGTYYVTAGLIGLKTLFEMSWLKLFIYFGGSYQYNQYQSYYYDYYASNSYSSTSTHNYINIGAGPGIEFTIFKHVSFDIMIGYGLYQVNERLQATVSGEVGAFFRF